MQEFLDHLDHPAREYSPLPFWFLNGDLKHEEIRRQLRDFCDHGVYGVVLHPRMGLPKRIGYLSPVFFRYLRTAVETAAELDMKVVLYDEGMYPSGSAGGLIVKENPALASRGLGLTDRPLPTDTVLCSTAAGYLVERFSGGTIRGVHFGEDDGEKNAPPSADILNPAAVQRFIGLTHDAYAREFGSYFGSTIIGIFTDEPSILGRNVSGLFPWSAGFAQVFTQAGGCPEGLAGLFSGKENSDTLLYRQLILQRESEVYYGSLSRWCDHHGIALMGHPHQSDDIEVLRHFQVPGQDLVYRMVAPEKGGVTGMDSVMGKCGADMAYLMNRRRNANECFGACGRADDPWHFPGSDMKWMIDYLAVRGVNMFIPHAFYYSLLGKRRAERPPDVGPGNIWWPYYSQWASYMARMSCLRTETDTICPTAVLCRNRDMKPEAAAPLFQSQRGFRYIPESMWKECREEKGVLVCRGKRYSAVLEEENLFPSVPHDPRAVPPDCVCLPPQKDLRAARLVWRGQDIWLLTNEGTSPLSGDILLPTASPLGRYDLWTGKRWKQKSLPENGMQRISLTLLPFESTLLFACADPSFREALPEKIMPGKTISNQDFSLIQEEPASLQKIYAAQVGPSPTGLLVELEAEEMTALEVNGQFIGVSFWSPHRFEVPAAMTQSPVSLRLTVTGSLANRYGKTPIFYGLK